MPLPYQSGRGGIQNNIGGPTLIPQFFPNYVKNDPHGATVMAAESPAAALVDTPRGIASAVVEFGGTVTTGDVISITLTHPQLPSGAITASYTTLAGDTLLNIGIGLVRIFQNLLNFNSASGTPPSNTSYNNLNPSPIVVEFKPSTNDLFFYWTGPMGNFAVISGSVSGAATETLTFNPSNGQLSGGTGPVFVANNFNFTYNGSVMSFYYGQAKFLDAEFLSVLATQDMPVV